MNPAYDLQEDEFSFEKAKMADTSRPLAVVVSIEAWVDFAEAFRQVTNQIEECQEVGRPAGLDCEINETIAALITGESASAAQL